MIARSLAYEMWPKSACDFLAPLLHPRNRRLAGGYFGSKETNIVLDRIWRSPDGRNNCIIYEGVDNLMKEVLAGTRLDEYLYNRQMRLAICGDVDRILPTI